MSPVMPVGVLDPPRYVLDACSVIALLKKEDGSELVASLLQKANTLTVKIFVHRVTLAEVYYDTLRSSGFENANLMLDGFKNVTISIVDELSDSFIQKVGKYKVHHKISFADAFVLALAETQAATVVSSDHHEFDAIANAGILSFRFIR